jgi:nitrate/nitrite transporter NarK
MGTDRADRLSPADVAAEAANWAGGLGIIGVALFPFALPLIALTALALLPLLAVALVAALVALPFLAVRALVRRVGQGRPRPAAAAPSRTARVPSARTS